MGASQFLDMLGRLITLPFVHNFTHPPLFIPVTLQVCHDDASLVTLQVSIRGILSYSSVVMGVIDESAVQIPTQPSPKWHRNRRPPVTLFLIYEQAPLLHSQSNMLSPTWSFHHDYLHSYKILTLQFPNLIIQRLACSMGAPCRLYQIYDRGLLSNIALPPYCCSWALRDHFVLMVACREVFDSHSMWVCLLRANPDHSLGWSDLEELWSWAFVHD